MQMMLLLTNAGSLQVADLKKLIEVTKVADYAVANRKMIYSGKFLE